MFVVVIVITVAQVFCSLLIRSWVTCQRFRGSEGFLLIVLRNLTVFRAFDSRLGRNILRPYQS